MCFFELTFAVNQNNFNFAVKITFANRKLEGLLQDDRKSITAFGKLRAAKIKLRLTQLLFSESLEDLRNMPGHFHELRNDRKGQWACDLDHPYRLVFTANQLPIPTNQHGSFIWSEIKSVRVIEIVNYHKEL